MIPPLTKEEFLEGLTSDDLTFDSLYQAYLFGRLDGIMSTRVVMKKEKKDD